MDGCGLFLSGVNGIKCNTSRWSFCRLFASVCYFELLEPLFCMFLVFLIFTESCRVPVYRERCHLRRWHQRTVRRLCVLHWLQILLPFLQIWRPHSCRRQPGYPVVQAPCTREVSQPFFPRNLFSHMPIPPVPLPGTTRISQSSVDHTKLGILFTCILIYMLSE